MSKRYYWLKLKNDFFNQRESKRLRKKKSYKEGARNKGI